MTVKEIGAGAETCLALFVSIREGETLDDRPAGTTQAA
jgi:hypothetical protein